MLLELNMRHEGIFEMTWDIARLFRDTRHWATPVKGPLNEACGAIVAFCTDGGTLPHKTVQRNASKIEKSKNELSCIGLLW